MKKRVCAAAVACICLCLPAGAAYAQYVAEPSAASSDPAATYARLVAAGSHCAGQRLWFDVAVGGLELTATAEGQRARYRMAFNQITEAWNWHPEAAAEGRDYYQFKYLPLDSIEEPRPSYAAEDKIGTVQQMQVRWRHDYFLAFDNAYAFFSPADDDDAGFTASWPTMAGSGAILMRALVRLAPPCFAQSTTFWKATSAQPVDLTLKKYYLMGRIERIEFVDRMRGTVRASLTPAP
jgi:hypothetical protein